MGHFGSPFFLVFYIIAHFEGKVKMFFALQKSREQLFGALGVLLFYNF